MTGDLRPSTQELAAELTIVWLSNPDQSRSITPSCVFYRDRRRLSKAELAVESVLAFARADADHGQIGLNVGGPPCDK